MKVKMKEKMKRDKDVRKDVFFLSFRTILHSMKICNNCNVCNFNADLLFWNR